jgi:hypothetical protein
MTVFIRGNVKLRIPAVQCVSKIAVGASIEVLTESVVDADGPGHALLTLDCGEHLGGVLECHWPFAQRVADGEQVDKPSE